MKKIMSIMIIVVLGLSLTSTCYSWGQKKGSDVRAEYFIEDTQERDMQYEYLFLGLDDIEILSEYKNLVNLSNISSPLMADLYLDYEKWINANFMYENYFLSIALSKLVIWHYEDAREVFDLDEKGKSAFKEMIDIFESKIPPVEIMIQSNGDKSAYLKFIKKLRKYYTTTETRGCILKQDLYEKVQKL